MVYRFGTPLAILMLTSNYIKGDSDDFIKIHFLPVQVLVFLLLRMGGAIQGFLRKNIIFIPWTA